MSGNQDCHDNGGRETSLSSGLLSMETAFRRQAGVPVHTEKAIAEDLWSHWRQAQWGAPSVPEESSIVSGFPSPKQVAEMLPLQAAISREKDAK